ncbi:MAG: aminoglycoside phosphotransferase [Actinotalea sp.]|nr:aminoglycoside phosphotransferase [Actinotalea sp.]
MTVEPGTTDDPIEARPAEDDRVLDILQEWAPRQRWFPAKGTTAALDRVAVVDLVDPDHEADVAVHLLRLPRGGVLQVPVVLRPADGAERTGVIATLPDQDGAAATLVVDGCHDVAFVRAWLDRAEHDAGIRPVLEGLKVMTGEQSNTSILLPSTGPPAILKIFRAVSAGPNPDVDVPLALSRAGWGGVPRPLAWLTAAWGQGEEREVGHLGVLSELVVGARDGFELACRYARDGLDFGNLAEDLGRTTAQMHAALRSAMPSQAPSTGVVAALRRRAAAAVAAAPVLEHRAAGIGAVITAVEQVGGLPPVQRVHGDYHLGQVLHSGRGWYVLDFEGEPQASADERTRPDLALRDLAGMLRSLDYAAAVGRAASPEWSLAARERLVRGYEREAGSGPVDLRAGTATVLLRALELDKALYEVVYETRNRPTWVQIPLEGVDRLLAEQS